MFSFFKKHRMLFIVVTIVLCVFLVFVVPLIINWVYEIPAFWSFLEMNWKAEVMLTYYGTLLGALATIVAVVITILFTVDNQKSERKLSIKPYLSSKMIPFQKLLENTYNNECTYFIISKGMIEYDSEMPKQLEQDLKDYDSYQKVNAKASLVNNIAKNTPSFPYLKSKAVMLYSIENYGANTAIDLSISINDLSSMNFCLKVGESKHCCLIFDKYYFDKYNIVQLLYTDINSMAKYRQTERFIIDSSNSAFPSIGQTNGDFLTKPEEINKKSMKK